MSLVAAGANASNVDFLPDVDANRLLIVTENTDGYVDALHVAARIGYSVCRISKRDDLTEALFDVSPTVVLIDLTAATLNGLEILRLIGRSRYRGAVVLVGNLDERALATIRRFAAAILVNVWETLALPIEVTAFAELLRRLIRCVPHYTGADVLRAVRSGEVAARFQPYVTRGTADTWRTAGAEIVPHWQVASGVTLMPVEFNALTADPEVDAAFIHRMLGLAHQAQASWHSDNAMIPVTVPLPGRLITTEFIARLCEPRLTARAARYPLALKLRMGDLGNLCLAYRSRLAYLRRNGYRVVIELDVDDLWRARDVARCPIDEICLAPALTRSLEPSADRRRMAALALTAARAANIAVRATGVVSRASLDVVLRLRVTTLQGDLISDPLTESALPGWSLASRRAAAPGFFSQVDERDSNAGSQHQ